MTAERRGRLDWAVEGREWPNRAASRFVDAGGVRFHVQVAGTGPTLLLAHGTGASTHSWRDLLPRLAERFTVVAPDLPGHAFTGRPPDRAMSLSGMAAALSALLDTLDMSPRLVVGHSAGAAVLTRMALDRRIAPAGIVALNGALLPIGGIAGRVFSPLARVLASTSLAPRLFASVTEQSAVDRLLGETGSRLDRRGRSLYGRLARDPAHVGGALAMMARWELDDLARRLPTLPVPLLLIAGLRDASVPPSDARRIRAMVPDGELVEQGGLGHLAHEEAPEATAELILAFATSRGVLG